MLVAVLFTFYINGENKVETELFVYSRKSYFWQFVLYLHAVDLLCYPWLKTSRFEATALTEMRHFYIASLIMAAQS